MTTRTIEEFRAQAAELRKQAARVSRDDVKEQLLLMAADWEKLARDEEKLGRLRKVEGAPLSSAAARK